jgi:hypothetical protein
VTDAPAIVLELLVDERDGWLDTDEESEQMRPVRPPLQLPSAPRRTHRP